MAKITVDKDQFVSVTVRAKEPEMAVKIANAYPEALSRLNRTIALSQAAHRWEYFEGPLEQEKNKLADAEEQLKQAQQKTGMVLPEAQVQLGLNAIAQLKSQITGLNEQLAALMTGSTDQNPQVVQLKSQIASLNGQLARLQAQNGGSGTKTSSAEMPGLTLEIERKAREVRFHEAR
jgi:capsule polysaccharide export protein KpsE/RkpR